ncbi:Sde2 N-terminal domain [Trinorchestia longiramus]|nr:Sde2 N-terminal domain [Trinorchestia longiramus]
MESSQHCVVSHLLGARKTWMVPRTIGTAAQLRQYLHELEGCPPSSMVLQAAGHVLEPFSPLPLRDTTTVTLALPGGKGGFGSMLRAIGAQIEKTTNKEACRDLSGRRLRDINQEKKLKEALEKRKEKERERLDKRKKKFEALKEQPRHTFNDDSFYKEQEEITSSLFDSVEKGLKLAAEQSSKSEAKPSDETEITTSQPSSSNGIKRKCDEKAQAPKFKKGRFFDDLDELSDDSDDAEH